MSEGQRVNIQYSVNVEELPQTLSELVKEAETRLLACTNEFMKSSVSRTMIQHENYLRCAEKIDEVRLQLADIDYRLQDSSAMLRGLANMRATPPQPENRVEEIMEKVEETKELAQQALAEQEKVEW